MIDWAEFTIALKKFASERDAKLNEKNLAHAVVLQGKINELNLKLTAWMRDNYK